MTFTLGASFPERIAAIAPVASQSFVQADSLARPVPVYFVAGTADPLIPYHGGHVTLPWGNTHSMPPVQESVDAWAKLDGCPPEPQVVSDANGVRVLRYGPGKGDAEVIFTTIEGNGHHWPDTGRALTARDLRSHARSLQRHGPDLGFLREASAAVIGERNYFAGSARDFVGDRLQFRGFVGRNLHEAVKELRGCAFGAVVIVVS